MGAKEHFEVYGFLITKPLQLMIVLAIIEQLPKLVKKELLIVDYFVGAKEVSQRLATVEILNSSVIFLENDAEAFHLACKKRYAKLFIDSDVGFKRNLTLLNLAIHSKKTILVVYEEGLGTYRNDLYKGIKKKILLLLGCGVNFGGNWFTKELYIYDPKIYLTNIRKIKIEKIRKSISQLLADKKQLLANIFAADYFFNHLKDVKKTNCVIYLSGWSVDNACLDMLKNSTKMVYVKLHPHIKNHTFNEFDYFLVDTYIPAEIVINELSMVYLNVIVVHHGSSVSRYVENENIIYMLVDEFKSGRRL